ncbi:MAG: hypothetical protein U0996_25730 [Planctomycetaceae bacterium]
MAKKGVHAGRTTNEGAEERASVEVTVPRLKIVVTVSDQAMSRARQIGKQLGDAGMIIETPLEDLGQFLGSVSQSQFSDLSEIEGVAAVEVLGTLQIPPSPLDPQ